MGPRRHGEPEGSAFADLLNSGVEGGQSVVAHALDERIASNLNGVASPWPVRGSLFDEGYCDSPWLIHLRRQHESQSVVRALYDYAGGPAGTRLTYRSTELEPGFVVHGQRG
jgi:hypothetical protein